MPQADLGAHRLRRNLRLERTWREGDGSWGPQTSQPDTGLRSCSHMDPTPPSPRSGEVGTLTSQALSLPPCPLPTSSYCPSHYPPLVPFAAHLTPSNDSSACGSSPSMYCHGGGNRGGGLPPPQEETS